MNSMSAGTQSFYFYWKFYWPLTLMGLTSVLGRQIQNGVLARYPDAVQEIATFAIASSIFQFFSASTSFVPQMTNVMIEGRRDYRFVRTFVLGLIGIQIFLSLLVAQTSLGQHYMSKAFFLSPSVLEKVNLYILMMTPNLFLDGWAQVYIGLLIKFEKTKAVTLSNISYLVLMIVGLFMGLWLEWNIVYTLVSSQVLAYGLRLVGTWYYANRVCVLDKSRLSQTSLMSLWEFFWPVGLTSTMFSFTRPIIYSFASRLPEGVMVIAALRIAFDFNMVFQNMVNQFRHVYLTFAKNDLSGVISFMLKTVTVISVLMVLAVVSGLLEFVLVRMMDVTPEVSKMSQEVFLVLCLLPILICLRNFFHGSSMLKRKTLVMGMAAILRVGATALMAWLFLSLGILNHTTAGFTLVFGFFVEMIANASQHGFRINERKKGKESVED